MPITDDDQLARAIDEFQRLSNAPRGSDEERRRIEIDADIKAYTMTQTEAMRPAKPDGSIL